MFTIAQKTLIIAPVNRQGFTAPLALIGLAVIALLLAGAYLARQKPPVVNNFEDCIRAGYPSLLSYPGQCNTPDGRHFVQELSEEEKKKLIPPPSL